MDNPEVTSTSNQDKMKEENRDTATRPGNVNDSVESSGKPAENAEKQSDLDKVAAIAVITEDTVTDNATPVLTVSGNADDTKQNTVSAGTDNIKEEEDGEITEKTPEKSKIEVSAINDDIATMLEDPKNSPPSEPATIADIGRNKSDQTSLLKDEVVLNPKTKATNAPTVCKIQNDEKPDPKMKEETKEGTVPMEVDSSETNQPDTRVEEPPVKPRIDVSASSTATTTATTTTYSTRGRSTETTSGEERSERVGVRDAFEESPRPKDPPSGVSFLVEAMTEEERRTRTRFLPDVDGMHMLRKNEIKDDIALARSLPTILNGTGNMQTRAERLGIAAGQDNDSMDTHANEGRLAINHEDTTRIILPSSSMKIPSDAFVAPSGVVVGEIDGNTEVKESERTVPSPSMVESVMSFNPPRPPESVGGKKKHRMIRWERRPEDIEVDMKNYRRTVQRTREELEKSEKEYERLEMIDAHLRRHFLNHSELLNQEYNNLQDELEVEVENLILESDLVGSRTRSRNLTKVDVVMRDVLAMLTRNEQKDVSMDGAGSEQSTSNDLVPGMGGLNAQAFLDWERSTELESMKPSISWIEPGQWVKTICGEGTVVAVIPPLPPQEKAGNSSVDSGKKSELQKRLKNRRDVRGRKVDDVGDEGEFDPLLPLRVKVRLGYGVGIFNPTSIVKMEDPAHFTDAKLAKRWTGMVDSALKVGSCIDLQGMLLNTENTIESVVDRASNETKETFSKDVAGGSKLTDTDTQYASKMSNENVLTVGSSLIPTKGGRGNFLQKLELPEIEETLERVLYKGHGVLGRKSNPGVTKNMRKWEDDEQEYLNLRASVLQLKNALYRQRRIRVLNDRTTASMNDRHLRAEELVSEMRLDLKSLKRRLGDELNELGITDGMANQILFQFYQGHQDEDKGDASTPKRLRRTGSMIEEMLTDIDVAHDRRDDDPRDSMDDQGTDDLSGDDLEARRPTKKVRSGISGE